MATTYVNWGKSRVKLTWQASDQLPDGSLITSVHGFCFNKHGKLLMVDLNDRGWDFPGGHIEKDETPLQCIKREAYEEGYVSGDCLLIGSVIVDHTNNPNFNPDGPYPKVGYQVFYRMDIKTTHPFKANYEAKRRTFIDPTEVANYYPNWHVVYQSAMRRCIFRRGR
ncbi:NUDIX hydrolase [Alkalibacillus silvisoli]|uniref:Nudix hydrolase domain-containing protein n=1 Tax=Alkalibacillus silvisoli TaxID=392823 RepID=A0ABN0ZNX9_9BACI